MADLFFLLSKLLGMMIRVETVLLLMIGAGLLLGLRRPRRGRMWIGAAWLGFLLIAIFPLGNQLLRPLEARFSAHPHLDDVDAIIVLGGGADPATSAHWGDATLNEAGERYLAAIMLAHRFPEARLLFSGGSGRVIGTLRSEAAVARDILVQGGVAPSRIRLESGSRTTAENARLLRAMIAQGQGGGRQVLVTSAYHMPRAMGSMCSAGWRGLVAWPTDYRTSSFAEGVGWNLQANLQDLNAGIKEWVGLLGYYATGRSSELMPGDCTSPA